MTLTLRPCLALVSFALALVACDEGVHTDDEFRGSGELTQGATLEYGIHLQPVRVTSYSFGSAMEDALGGQGEDILIGGAGAPVDDALIAVEFEGIAPVGELALDEGVITLRRDGQSVQAPIVASRVQISIDDAGRALTHVDFAEQEDVDQADFLVWNHTNGPSAAPPEPVDSIEYMLVAADGTTTTCFADLQPTEQLSFNFTKIDHTRAGLAFDIADNCADVLEAAAAERPSSAFFVRCDRTTMATLVGMHKFSNVTLKRGVIKATGEAVIEDLAN